MAKFQVTYGKAGIPARFWDRKILDDTNLSEKEELEKARRELRPIQEVK